MNSLLGIFAALTPDVLAALGRILLTAGKVATLGSDALKEGFLQSVVAGLSPDRVAANAAAIVGAELDALQLAADVLAVQGVLLAQEAERVGATIESPPYDR